MEEQVSRGRAMAKKRALRSRFTTPAEANGARGFGPARPMTSNESTEKKQWAMKEKTAKKKTTPGWRL
jgi:outer membrane protein OmpA-like peptidoglycan-associated protein